MKLIEPSVELIEQEPGIEGIYKQIERAGRICYKSEDKMEGKDVTKVENINGTNVTIRVYRLSEPFVKMLIEHEHNAMLEHGTVYLKVNLPKDEITPGESLYHYKRNPYSTYNVFEGVAYVTTNYRVLVENNWLDDLRYLCEPTEYHEKRYTLKFTTSIGITRELIRHRHFSFANESTRYCNYSKDKFGGEISYIMPYWFPDANLQQQEAFMQMCKNTEDCYIALLGVWDERKPDMRFKTGFKDNPLTPQQAREILPLATKSEIIMTGFESDWEAFFKLRCDKAAHPDMQYLANKAKENFPVAIY